MKHMRRLICMALMIATVLSLSVSAFAAEYTFESTSDSEYYPSTSYHHLYHHLRHTHLRGRFGKDYRQYRLELSAGHGRQPHHHHHLSSQPAQQTSLCSGCGSGSLKPLRRNGFAVLSFIGAVISNKPLTRLDFCIILKSLRRI